MENQLYVALKNNKLFLDIDLEDIELSDIHAELKPLKEGEILYREEDDSDRIYLVVSGEINLLKKKLLGSTKSFIFGENDFLGYDEIAEDTARTSTAVALRDSYLIAISLDDLQTLLDRNHLIKTNLLNFSDIQPGIEDSEELSSAVADEPAPPDEQPKPEDHKDRKTDVTSFEQSLKDDLIDKHDTTIEDDTSLYEEELKEDTFQKVHSDEMPDDQIEKNLEEPSQTPEEPLFPDEDEDSDDFEPHLSDESDAAELNDTQAAGLDEDTLSAIASQEDLTESPKTEEKRKKLSDFDDAFYAAFSEEKQDDEKASEDDDDLIKMNETYEDFNEREGIEDHSDVSEPVISDEEEIEKETEFESSQNSEEVDKIEKDEVTSDKDLDDPDEWNFQPDDQLPEDTEPSRKYEQIDESRTSDESEFSDEQKRVEDPAAADEPKPVETASVFESKINSGSENLESSQLKKIIEASQLVNSNIKIDEVLNNIVTVATDLTNADRGTLYLIDRENNELWSKVAMGNETKEIRLKIGEGIAGWVAANGEIVNIEDVTTDDRFKADYDKSSGYETKSMLCFPIKDREDQIVGVLQLLNSKAGKFTGQDEEFLSAISIQCALALQNAEMLEKLLQGERVSSLGKMTNFLIQDIKKPVLVSKRYAEHLQSKELNKDAAQIVEMILDQLTQVADLVQTTSSYAEGKSVLRTSRVSFNEVIKEFTDRLESYVKSRGSQIELNQGDDVKVQIDSKEFFQAFNHLIRNACDAMPEGGRIFVSTKVNGNDAILSVKDDGIGISENLKDKIFEPFMTHGKKEGTGLGLTITKKIIEGHSGTIAVESALGEGTELIITLPKASAL